MLDFFFRVLKGALTNKPYAFKFRAWELELNRALNLFDSFCDEIFVQVRGLNVMRVLPSKEGLFPEFNWITDKVRFFFDSLAYQRVVEPFVFSENLLLKSDWKYLLSSLAFSLLKVRQCFMKRIFINSTVYENSFLNSYSCNNLLFQGSFNTDLFDLLHFNKLRRKVGGGFMLSSDLDKGFVSNSYCLQSFNTNLFTLPSLRELLFNFVGFGFLILVGIDLRFEIPKLNLILKKSVKKKKLKLVLIGVKLLNLVRCKVYHVGMDFNSVFEILQGRHWLNNLILKEEGIKRHLMKKRHARKYHLRLVSNLLFVGTRSFDLFDSSKFDFFVNVFCKKYNFRYFPVISQLGLVNKGLLNFRNNNVFFRMSSVESSFINFKNVGFDSFFGKNIGNGIVINNNFLTVKLKSFFCDTYDFYSNFLILPMSGIFERGFLTMSLFGKLKLSNKLLNGISSLRGVLEHRSTFELFEILFKFIEVNSCDSFLSSFDLLGKKYEKFPFVMKDRFENLLNLQTKFKHYNLSMHKACVRAVLYFKNRILNVFISKFFRMDDFSRNSFILNITQNLVAFRFLNYC